MEKPKVIIKLTPTKLWKLEKEKEKVQIKRKRRFPSYTFHLRKRRIFPLLKTLLIKSINCKNSKN